MRHLLFITLLISYAAMGQNTLTMPDNSSSPKASLSSIEWMAGHWRGTAFGGVTEEIWAPPLGGSMMFSFRLIVDGTVSFYELGHIREVDGTLIYELKHFNSDLKGWETKDEVQQFRLIKLEKNRVYFEGFTFERISDKEVNIYAAIGNEEGGSEEVQFNFKPL